jgi:dodecin
VLIRQRGLPRGEGRGAMSDHVYKVIELVGSSPTSVEDAIQNAIGRASKTLKNLRWFEVVQTRGHIEEGRLHHYQVVLKVGFTLEDNAGD